MTAVHSHTLSPPCSALRTAATVPAFTETAAAAPDAPDVAALPGTLPTADPLAIACDDGTVVATALALVP